jgi:poly(hydroxyalkanoate) depolymerase family esterase
MFFRGNHLRATSGLVPFKLTKGEKMKKILKSTSVVKPMVFFVYFLALVFGSLSIAYSGEFKEVTSFGSNPGNLKMYAFIPDNMPENAPLVVSLHGCSQDAAIYSASGWRNVAEHFKFYVLFPEQKMLNHMTSCFNWFQPGDTRRGHGEAKSIRSMIDKMLSSHSIDAGRIFVEGLSAGGYMAAIMLASYPVLFGGGAINAGGPSYCASNMLDALQCMGGIDQSPDSWGRLVRKQGFSYYYYAQGSDDDLGRGSDETTLQKKDTGNDYYDRGACGE